MSVRWETSGVGCCGVFSLLGKEEWERELGGCRI